MRKLALFMITAFSLGEGVCAYAKETAGLSVATAVAQAAKNNTNDKSSPSEQSEEPSGDEVKGASVRTMPLPMDGIAVVQGKNGKTYFVSTNGRYQFDGKIVNVYTNKSIESVDDAVDERYMTLADMSLSLADIATIAYGNPNLPLQGRVMIDPYCKECQRVLIDLEKIKDKVHLEIMIAPIAGKDSTVTGLNMWCAYEKNYSLGRQILADLIKGPPYQKYPEQADCKGQRLMLNTMLTRTLNLEGLPAFWRADGFAKAGVPDDIIGFLKSRRNKEQSGLRERKE